MTVFSAEYFEDDSSVDSLSVLKKAWCKLRPDGKEMQAGVFDWKIYVKEANTCTMKLLNSFGNDRLADSR